ncbi:MAG: hypothetical protein AB7F40_03555 [Victivallaceae bacterium]
MFDFNDSRYTHMPFAALDADGNPKQFCCIQNNGLWKLYHFTGHKWKRLKTGLPDDAFECGPCAEFEDGMWKVSFVAGGAKSNRRFRLYRMYGFNTEPMVQGFVDAGFVRKYHVVYAGRRGPITIVEPGRTVTLVLPGVEFLYRVSYDPFQPNRLLISGQFSGGEIFSWAYQPGMKKLYEVVADGVPAYKCALYEGDCYYAKREAGFEERHIVKAGSLVMNELPAEEHIVETEEFTNARPENPKFE